LKPSSSRPTSICRTAPAPTGAPAGLPPLRACLEGERRRQIGGGPAQRSVVVEGAGESGAQCPGGIEPAEVHGSTPVSSRA